MMRKKEDPFECILLNIALPGTCQILNGNYIKGILLLFLAGTINMKSNLNQMIFLLFNGETAKIQSAADLNWLMFYPCVYFFALWDAFKDAGGGRTPYSYLPCVFPVYFTTVGIIFSDKFNLLGIPGIVWGPVICFVPGLLLGLAAKVMLVKRLQVSSG
ncbi:hypothetical protein ACOJQI_12250 [Bacillus salacetis]|uniref:hypothetical protein n=1 Tax=Bacillus salacetis TaxID=2315464 RepID=UPI003BA06C7A